MAASLLLVILSVAALVAGDVVPDLPESRIIGGHEIEISDAPWQVYLGINNTHCGGSIISSRWVVTAAHCTYGYKTSHILIMAGSKKIDSRFTYKVEEIVIHERYIHNIYINDISLLKTVKEMKFDHSLKAVTLPAPGAKKPPVGTKLVVSGWGKIDDRTDPKFLRAVEVQLLDFEDCQTHHASDESTQLCAGLPGKDHCDGDSGGPLVNGDVLVGVVSYSANETCALLPGVYTDVAVYRSWISAHTDIDEKKFHS